MGINMQKADMIVDLQFGSTGKGLIAGYLAMKNEYDVVVTANMPNAGHTFIDAKGNKMIHKVLPNGVVSPKCKYALIGPGAVFSVEQLHTELHHLRKCGYNHFRVVIHPNAVVLTDEHRLAESEFGRVGSTMQGSAAAMIQKLKRDPKNQPIAREILARGGSQMVCSIEEYNNILLEASNILLEGAQGYSLGVNTEFYPYCTSRDCTPARFLADMGVPVPMLRRVIGTARVHPIRVGNPPGGWSGPCYPDQEEVTWEQLGVPAELTTVTKRERRVFTFSEKQIQDAIFACAPDEVFLNFCNYDRDEAERVMLHVDHALRCATGGRVCYLGWGPTVNDVREV